MKRLQIVYTFLFGDWIRIMCLACFIFVTVIVNLDRDVKIAEGWVLQNSRTEKARYKLLASAVPVSALVFYEWSLALRRKSERGI